MLLLAHRGCPAVDRPENTVAAVVAARQSAIDGVEVDVRLTADRILVCSHDAGLLRLAGSPLLIGHSTVDEIRQVALAGGHRTATLDENLAAARGRLVIEAKPVCDEAIARDTADSLCATLERAAPGPAVTVSSFDAALLRVIRSALRRAGRPYVRTALLGSPATSVHALMRRALDDGHDELHPHVRGLLGAPHLVGVAHALGASVTCWTVNRRSDLRRLAELGVDAAISDRPARELALRARTCSPAHGS